MDEERYIVITWEMDKSKHISRLKTKESAEYWCRRIKYVNNKWNKNVSAIAFKYDPVYVMDLHDDLVDEDNPYESFSEDLEHLREVQKDDRSFSIWQRNC